MVPWPYNMCNSVPCTVRLPDQSRANKELAVCNTWDIEPLDLLNGLALGSYQTPLTRQYLAFLTQ